MTCQSLLPETFFLFLLFGIILYGTYSAEKEQCFLWLFFSCSLVNHHVVVGINIQIYEITRFSEVSKNQFYKKKRFLVLFVFWIGQLRTRKKKERIFYFEFITVYPHRGVKCDKFEIEYSFLLFSCSELPDPKNKQY